MDEPLLLLVSERLDADTSIGDDAGLLVLAACEGDGAFVDALAGESPTGRTRPTPPNTAAVDAAGAYLRSISVEGFRGVGEQCEMRLTPGPGLTLVVGRNGSGKSSFVEALEVLLTNDSRRWSHRHEKAWKDGWRNLHHPEHAHVSAEFALDGVAATTTVSKDWSAQSELVNASAVVQTYGKPKAAFGSLGWDEALVAYRPILSYNELGSILDEGPSKLYDALVSILGLDDLRDALGRLGDVRKHLKQGVDVAKNQAVALQLELREINDERAASCLAALAKRPPDLAAISTVVTGTGEVTGTSEIETLRGFANLAPPDLDMVASAVVHARDVADLVDAVAGSEAEVAARTASLLETALDHHDHSGDGPCPVCGVGTLDAEWVERTREEVARLNRVARDARRATDAVREGARRLTSLLVTPSVYLPDGARLGLPIEDARAAWTEWLEIPTNDLRIAADHIETQAVVLAEAVGSLREAAAVALVEREDRWSPIAEKLAAWLEIARRSQASIGLGKTVDQAEKWLKGAMDELRNQRLAPLAKHAAEIWRVLSQHSNVELGPMQLTGTGTHRRVTLDVRVDGVDSVALSVMSQGELHALALAIFLPRVTLSESPFRFLVIDDPVQAMDPAKVEGLARVLEATAKKRQVIVFTHDDRLPQAVRLLGIDASVIQVSRRAGSIVELTPGGDPATIHLDDAEAVALSKELPETVRARVVPGYCRLALEAVLNDVIRRKLLAEGGAHTEIEDRLIAVTTLTSRAALALFGDTNRGSEVLSRLGTYGHWAQDAYQAANKGAHGGYGGNLTTLVRDTRKLADKLRTAP